MQKTEKCMDTVAFLPFFVYFWSATENGTCTNLMHYVHFCWRRREMRYKLKVSWEMHSLTKSYFSNRGSCSTIKFTSETTYTGVCMNCIMNQWSAALFLGTLKQCSHYRDWPNSDVKLINIHRFTLTCGVQSSGLLWCDPLPYSLAWDSRPAQTYQTCPEELWRKHTETHHPHPVNHSISLHMELSIGTFPLQICTKLWRYFINVDKKVFWNDGVSINQCYATKM